MRNAPQLTKIDEAKRLYQEAFKEFEIAKGHRDEIRARDTCSKVWLGVVKASEALFLLKGVKEEELPKTHRGMRYFLRVYADKELRRLFFAIRDALHIDGYYEGIIDFDELPEYLDAAREYIDKVKDSVAQN